MKRLENKACITKIGSGNELFFTNWAIECKDRGEHF